jgi:hypothetical protein
VNLTFTDTTELHRDRLKALAAAAWQDNVVTESERTDLLNVAKARQYKIPIVSVDGFAHLIRRSVSIRRAGSRPGCSHRGRSR